MSKKKVNKDSRVNPKQYFVLYKYIFGTSTYCMGFSYRVPS